MILALHTHITTNNKPFLVIRGANQSFCSGLDLTTPSLLSRETIQSISIIMQETTQYLTSSPTISIAAINGPAIGGGAELAIACDLRIASSGSSMRFVHGRRGVIPGFGGVTRLTHLMGRTRALELLLTSETIAGDKWQHLSTLTDVNPQVWDDDDVLIQTILRGLNVDHHHHHHEWMSALKQCIHTASTQPPPVSYQYEHDHFIQLWQNKK
jgi:enoyl-CoA hydratase/carnithine racemase